MRPSTHITEAVLRRWPLPLPNGELGKDGRGSVLVVGGCQKIPGAAILAAVAALRAGAGKLKIATSHSVAPLVAMTVPEACVIGLPQMRDGELNATACRPLRGALARFDAVLIGPGMGQSAKGIAKELVGATRGGDGPAIVLDAGALEAFARRDQFARGREPTLVATPHAGEMASVWGISREEVLADPAAVAAQAAKHLGAIVVLKGARTYISAPDGVMFHNTAGNSGLATSGSGDVLSGIIAGLCARGAAPLQAAAWGVFLHARAAEILARKVAPLGFLAREILAELPSVMAGIGPARRHRRPR